MHRGAAVMKKILLGAGIVLAITSLLLWKPVNDVGTHVQQQEETLYSLRFGHNIPADSAMHQAALRYAQAVKQKTGGRVNIDVYPEQQLGNDHQMVEMARAGELDILLTPTAKMSVPVPAMQYADLPFLFPTRQDAYDMLDGEPGKMLLAKLDDIDLLGVTFWENGFKHFTGNRPLLEPEDFRGLRIRTMKSRIIMDQFRAFDAHPVPIDFHATRQALADGVVDGQENPLIATVSMGFHEVQSDLTLSEHAYLGYVFSISRKVFEKLPQDIQQTLIAEAVGLTPWQRRETLRREAALLETVRQAGVRVHELERGAREKFAEQTAFIVDKFEPVIGVDVVSMTQKLLSAKYGQDDILIGLDADLSAASATSALAIKRGIMLAIETINASGGVLGKQLALVVKDNHGQPSLGVGNVEKYIQNPSVVAVIAGQQSSVVLAETERAQQSGMPLLAAWSPAAAITETGENSFIFRLSANDRIAGPFIIDHVLKNYQRPAMLYENSLWGRGNLKTMSQHLKQRGLDFVWAESFNRGTRNFMTSLNEIDKAQADVIVIVANAVEGQSLLQAVSERDKPLPLVSHWGISDSDFWRRNRALANRVKLEFLQTFSFRDHSVPKVQALAQRYRERYGFDPGRQIPQPAAVAHGYDLVHLLALAIEQAATTERKAVREALESLSLYQGVVKRYAPAFDPARHDALDRQDYFMARFDENGSIVPLQ